MEIKVDYPILYIHPVHHEISSSREQDMVGDIRYLRNKNHCEKYNKNVIIIDKLGRKFTQIGLKELGKVSFWLSIMWGGKIVRVSPILEEKIEKISFEDTKEFILDIMREKPKKWLPYGPMNLVEEMVREKTTFLELMHFFNNKIKP